MTALSRAGRRVHGMFEHHPLLRLLAVNLGSGIVLALLAVGGLLLLSPPLRRLIAGDQAPATALVLLMSGFIVTFASCAMGSAVMRIGAER